LKALENFFGKVKDISVPSIKGLEFRVSVATLFASNVAGKINKFTKTC
jgi:hypothetical protein